MELVEEIDCGGSLFTHAETGGVEDRIVLTKFLFIRTGYSTTAEVSPPLGALYLISVLRSELEADCRLLDPLVHPRPAEEIVRQAVQARPDFIGLGSLSCQSPAFHELARRLRQALPEVPIIAGGPYPTTQTHDALSDRSVDACVLGEGEHTLPLLIRAIQYKTSLKEIPGIAFRGDDHDVVITPPAIPVAPLDSLPFPAHDLADFDAMERQARFDNVRKRARYFMMFSSRGCPYRCIYCHPMFGKKFRPRSPENVLAEIDDLRLKYGVREIEFCDDSFNLDRQRSIAICRGLVERGAPVSLSFPIGLRGDALDEEVIDWMARAGTYKAGIAIETASSRLQNEIGKNLDLEKARKSIDAFVKRRVIAIGFFMFGFPGESLAEMRRTVQFAANSRLHLALFMFVQVLPGSALSEMYAKEGRRPMRNSDLSHYFDPKTADFSLSPVEPRRIRNILRRAWLQFYINPVRLARLLRDFPRKRKLIDFPLLLLARSLLPRLETLLVQRRRLKVWK